MKYETLIGLEVHIELATESKIFCSCKTEFGAEPNTHVCPACSGMPGMLPILNRRAVDLAMTAGMMLGCRINRTTAFDRKSYYYPDLPSSYQTTQHFAPIAVNGTLEIEAKTGKKSVRIKQIHLEEDAGKLIHDAVTGATLIDYNRAGVPLIEIVSEPDLSSAEEAVAYLERLRLLLRFAGVSSCRMEEGSMRCDVNLSVRPEGSDKLGVRTEIKNMNSPSAIARAIEHEAARHVDALEGGTEALVPETRRWDDAEGKTFAMRGKESAGDYRYFPEPNVMPVVIDGAWQDSVKATLPELPEKKRARYVGELGLSEYDADLLCDSRTLCDAFEAALDVCGSAKEAANWLISDCMSLLNKRRMTADALPVGGASLGKLIKLCMDGAVSRVNGRKILSAMFDAPVEPEAYAKENDLVVSDDRGKMYEVIAAAAAAEPKAVADYKSGKEKALLAIFGRCMRALRGNCDHAVLREALIEYINKQ